MEGICYFQYQTSNIYIQLHEPEIALSEIFSKTCLQGTL